MCFVLVEPYGIASLNENEIQDRKDSGGVSDSHAKQRATQLGTHRRGSERCRVPPVFRGGADDDVGQICSPGGVRLFQATTTSASARSLSRGVRRRRAEICIFSVGDGTSKEGTWKV